MSTEINKKIVKESSFLLLGQLYFMLSSLIIVMLLTRLLSVDDFGKFIFAQTVINLVAVFGYMGFPNAITRYTAYYKGSDNWGKVKALFYRLSKSIFILNILLGIVVFFACHLFSDRLFRIEGAGLIIALLALVYPFRSVSVAVSSFFSGLREMRYTSLLQNVTQPTMKIILIIILIIFSKTLLIHWVYGLIVLFVIDSFLALYIFINKRPAQFKSIESGSIDQREIYNFALPIFFSSVLLVGINNVDVLMLGYFDVAKEVGIYKVYKIMVTFLLGAISALAMVYRPSLTELIARKDDEGIKSLYFRISKWYQFLAFFGCMSIVILGPPLGRLFFGESYVLANPMLIFVLAAGPLLTGLTGPEVMTLEAYGRTRLIMINSFISLLVIISTGYYLTPMFGKVGAALATLTGYFSLHLLGTIEVYRLEGIHPFPKQSLTFIASSVITICCLLFLSLNSELNDNAIIYYVIVIAVILLYIFSLYLTKIFDTEDKRIAVMLFQKMTGKG